jgi:hypothetical protein
LLSPLVVVHMLTFVYIVQVRDFQLVYFTHTSYCVVSLRGYFKCTKVVFIGWCTFKFYLFCVIYSVWLYFRRLNFESWKVIFIARASFEFSSTFILRGFISFYFGHRYLMELRLISRLSLKLNLLSLSRICHLESTLRLFICYIFYLKRFILGLIWSIRDKGLWSKYISLSVNKNTPIDPILDIDIAGSSTFTGK